MTLIARVLASTVLIINLAFADESNVAFADGAKVATDSPQANASPNDYFADLKVELQKSWPKNRLVRFVFHGHSVPAGYFRTPIVRRFDSYPTLFHQAICEKFPNAVIDVCVTAIGGENSSSGKLRFEDEVLSLNPDVVFIDYALNDRWKGLALAEASWREMIEQAQQANVRVVLLTPTADSKEDILDDEAPLALHSKQIRRLAAEYQVPVVDSYAGFRKRVMAGTEVKELLAQPNHPNRDGHQIVAGLIAELFN